MDFLLVLRLSGAVDERFAVVVMVSLLCVSL